MNTLEIKIDKVKAKELYRAYLTHQHYEQPVDEENRLIAAGRMVIQALESIRLQGVGDDGWPKLAIARADQDMQTVTIRSDGSARMRRVERMWRSMSAIDLDFDWPPGSFPPPKDRRFNGEALVPLVPLPLRPKRGLANYHVLWEADWKRAIPQDPLLLRRLGKGDLWLVLAQWDLTEVERAALSTRVNAA